MLTQSAIQKLLQQRDLLEDNPWSIWTGSDAATATQLLNDDGSIPYVRRVNVTDQMFAVDTRLTISTELYRVTLIANGEPNANVKYWLSSDDGTNKDAVRWLKRESKCKRTFWWIYLVNDK